MQRLITVIRTSIVIGFLICGFVSIFTVFYFTSPPMETDSLWRFIDHLVRLSSVYWWMYLITVAVWAATLFFFKRYKLIDALVDIPPWLFLLIGATWAVWFPVNLAMLVVIAIVRIIGVVLDAVVCAIDNVVARISQRVVHRDEYGVVIDRLLPSGHARFVIVEDKTGKHELPVPVEMERAKQAVAWTYNMAEDEYDPVLRT